MIKTVYLVARNPRTTHEEFLKNWKQHAELSATFPSIQDVYLGIAQCSQIPGLSRPDLSDRYDGVNLLPVRGVIDALEVYDDPNIEVMLADELRVFATPVADSTLMTVETVLQDQPVGKVVLLEFVRRNTAVAENAFVKRWMGTRVRRLQSVERFSATVGRYVNDLVILDRPRVCEYDGISELWFEDVESALTLLDDPDYRRTAADDDVLTVSSRALFRTSFVWSR